MREDVDVTDLCERLDDVAGALDDYKLTSARDAVRSAIDTIKALEAERDALSTPPEPSPAITGDELDEETFGKLMNQAQLDSTELVGVMIHPDELAALKAEVTSLAERNKRLEDVVGRLSSSEAMTKSFLRRNNDEGLELLARMKFARAALSPPTSEGVQS